MLRNAPQKPRRAVNGLQIDSIDSSFLLWILSERTITVIELEENIRGNERINYQRAKPPCWKYLRAAAEAKMADVYISKQTQSRMYTNLPKMVRKVSNAGDLFSTAQHQHQCSDRVNRGHDALREWSGSGPSSCESWLCSPYIWTELFNQQTHSRMQ